MFMAALLLLLAACGEKSKEDVVKNLEKKLEDMSSYKTEASMTLNTGQEAQTYDIEIWHKKKDYYRVALKNESDEKGSQIILKNEEGVFVLTPALNKSYKFQSDWPKNSSQPYLYESLVNDILADSEAKFKSDEEYYVFQTKTNYQNSKNLPYQEIYFDKKSLTPLMVKVLDKDMNPLVEVKFDSFELDAQFSDDAFTTEKNMTSGALGIPVMAGEEQTNSFSILYPVQNVGDAQLVDETQVEMENGQRVILSFEGEKSYTLIEESVGAYPASATVPVQVNGDPVDLGFTVGAWTETSLEWNYNGMNFYLASEDLTKEEMIEVAQSVQGTAIK